MEIHLGKILKELREENSLTQKQLAEILGLNSVTYLCYEKEQREPPLDFGGENSDILSAGSF